LTYIDLERYNDADECFNKMQSWDPAKPDGFICHGWLAMEKKQYQEAIQFLQKAIQIEPNNGEIYLDLAKCYEEMNNNALQLQYLQLATRYDETNADVYYAIGMYYFNHERFDQANGFLQSALKWNPHHILSLNALAAIELDIKDNFEAAEKYYLDALKLEPNSLLTLMNLGYAYLNDEQFEKSEECFKKVLEINPREPSAMHNLGLLEREIKNDPHQAEQYFIMALEIKPDYLPALIDLGELYSKELKDSDKLDRIIETLQTAYTNDPDIEEIIKEFRHNK
jgi:tetratricopeptide (TPR) repeat protein